MVLTRAGPSRWWAAAAALAFIAGAPATAFGGAWTLPQGTGQLIETLYGWTDSGRPGAEIPRQAKTASMRRPMFNTA